MIVIAQEDEVLQQPNPSGAPPPDGQVVLEDDEQPIADGQAPKSEDSLQPDGPLPAQDFEPYDPGVDYERVTGPASKWEKENETLGIPEKVWLSTNENVPLRIVYTTLKGYTTERTVRPDHVHYARGHAILVAWCEMRNDWRAFIVDRISQAKLVG